MGKGVKATSGKPAKKGKSGSGAKTGTSKLPGYGQARKG